MEKQIELIEKDQFEFDNLPDRPEKPTSQEIADIITPKPQGVVADTSWTIYSPNERQIGLWQQMVDGVLKQKPVYEKRFDGTTPSAETTALSVSVSNIDILCEVNGRAGSSLSIPLMYQDDNNFFKGYKTSSGLEIWCKGSAVLSKPYAITVCYTKTTDTWQTVE